MNRAVRLTFAALAAAGILLVSCAPAMNPAPTEVPPIEAPTEAPVMELATEEPTAEPASERASTGTGGRALPALDDRPNRLIIKDAELKLLVEDTDLAIDGATQAVADCGGYIISSRVWYQEWLEQNYKYATITVGVPVDQFERAMRRLRGLALQVVDESASGQDVTDEYVDLESRLGNLEATRDRIRGFLDQAQTVEEALQVNDEMAVIEEQIEQVQGRMNYLYDRASFSTITIRIEPELPPLPEPPTPTPTPTPTPPPSWSPSRTIDEAGQTLGSVLRALIELAIWAGIVGVPLVAPPVLAVWGIGRLLRRRSTRTTSKTPLPSD